MAFSPCALSLFKHEVVVAKKQKKSGEENSPKMGKPKGRAKGVDVTKDFVTGSYSLSETITVFVENNKPVNVAERELVPTVGSESVFSSEGAAS